MPLLDEAKLSFTDREQASRPTGTARDGSTVHRLGDSPVFRERIGQAVVASLSNERVRGCDLTANGRSGPGLLNWLPIRRASDPHDQQGNGRCRSHPRLCAVPTLRPLVHADEPSLAMSRSTVYPAKPG
jgi:hypothetical protein